MLEPDVLQIAAEKRYTDFSNAVKQELANKLANNPTIQDHVSEFDRINNLKAVFAQINYPKDPANQLEEES